MTLAVIGGTGLSKLEGFKIVEQRSIDTPYGKPSSVLSIGELEGESVIFLPRHGEGHTHAPHKINYRANIWALHEAGATQIIAVAAVGGIRHDLPPEKLVIPDQIIDYTYGREQSFHSDDFSADKHIDFSYPYNEHLRQTLLHAAKSKQIEIIDGGTYGATQGPRLETAAEIKRMAQDGCAIVGMTGMPEAYLARELGMDYATCALVVNWAAGLTYGTITMQQIEHTLAGGMAHIKEILTAFIQMK